MDYKLQDLARFINGNIFPKDTALTEDEKAEIQAKGKISHKERCLFYTPSVFEYDRYSHESTDGDEKYLEFPEKYLSVVQGDVVISPITQLATIVRKHKASMLLSPNYVKVSLNEELIDSSYFIFWFNELSQARRQISEMKQGTTVIKLSTNSLGDMIISLPDLSQQQLLGTGYINSLKLTEQLKRRQGLQLLFLKGIEQQLLERESL